MEDLKREASRNEELRLRAMKGKVYSSELLPAESITGKNEKWLRKNEKHTQK